MTGYIHIYKQIFFILVFDIAPFHFVDLILKGPKKDMYVTLQINILGFFIKNCLISNTFVIYVTVSVSILDSKYRNIWISGPSFPFSPHLSICRALK